ncbi:hypothetical protein GJU40_02995 [Bacillus lacus]|uniref:Octanoyl-[GcvH]:protein N-octanoyltransferase n=1 Tax=Metabacillus lacus TaxID=1983721 RepID=A0A7X2LYQ0_9BACI|nr:lipoate--protein ligase family protein [Metabacillus lacus]MRX71137.1 hypothetical protein [Metabacillus lacus]
MLQTPLSLLSGKKWRIIDQSAMGPFFQAEQSFAIDDTLCASVGAGTSAATARTWVHHNTIVLGIQDTKLPYLKEGISYLESKGHRVIVRNSGGLAVVLDNGVLNISLILPQQEKGIDINRGYDAMWELVKVMLKNHNVNIEAKEIVGSYCPGSYDLSINGRKFAGISQRRLRNGVAVQIYLCADGSGSERAGLIRDFYSIALKKEQSKFVYPKVDPVTMSSLSELLQAEITVQSLMMNLLLTLKDLSSSIYASELTPEEAERYEVNLARMMDRNQKAFQ